MLPTEQPSVGFRVSFLCGSLPVRFLQGSQNQKHVFESQKDKPKNTQCSLIVVVVSEGIILEVTYLIYFLMSKIHYITRPHSQSFSHPWNNIGLVFFLS